MGAGLDRGADGVEVLDQAEVEGERGGAGGAEEVQRHARGAAVQHDRAGERADEGGELLLDDVRLDAASLPKPLTVGSPPWRTAGTDGSSSWTTTRAPGTRAATAADVGGEPLGQRLREVAAGAGVDDRAVAAGALQPGGERPRAGGLHLERAGPAAAHVVERVEVAVEELARPALVDARARDQPPAGRA